jgi:hypothetical protein
MALQSGLAAEENRDHHIDWAFCALQLVVSTDNSDLP